MHKNMYYGLKNENKIVRDQVKVVLCGQSINLQQKVPNRELTRAVCWLADFIKGLVLTIKILVSSFYALVDLKACEFELFYLHFIIAY